MENKVIKTLRKCIPFQLWNHVRDIWLRFYIAKAKASHLKSLDTLKNKDKIRVVFFVLHSSVWKLDDVFHLMQKDNRFSPCIVICPYMGYGGTRMLKDMNASCDYFISKGYETICSYDKLTGKWLDVKKEIKPDIVFFTNPHNLTKKEYYIWNFKDTLTCYVPYAFMAVSTYQKQFNQSFHNLIWTLYYETPFHKKIAEKHSIIRGRNVVVSGYPGCDVFMDTNYIPSKEVWKIKDRNIKRLIWSPHHLMREEIENSNFLEYYQIMLDIAKTYRNKLQIAFKPHPVVKSKLYTYEDWGKERTDNYYKEWENLSNGQLEDGDYIDLFHTSDALLHDCGSFISEYISMNKPSMYMIRNKNVTKGWNEYGEKVISVHYQGFSYDDVIRFIEDVVIQGNDSKKEERSVFIEEVLKVSDQSSASECIFTHLKSVIN